MSVTAVARARYRGTQWHLEHLRESRFGPDGIEVRDQRQAVWPDLVDARFAQLLTRDVQTLTRHNESAGPGGPNDFRVAKPNRLSTNRPIQTHDQNADVLKKLAQ